MKLHQGSNKISFTSNQPFIYSYSIYDYIDKIIIEENTDWKNERGEYGDLTITEVKDEGDNNNEISITFIPNYLKSSTRYIIIVGRKDDNNTFDSFNDPCYITQLLNERPKGIAIFTIYDIGNEITIKAIVDISSIIELNQDQYFIVNIVSQELRFGKNINFYKPYEFKYTSEKKSTGLEGVSLVLAIVLPIVGAVIIIVIALFVINYKKSTSLRSREESETILN